MKLLIVAVIALHALPAFSQAIRLSPSGRAEQLDPSRFQAREVWIPYWSEEGSDRSILHLRNSVHHHRLHASVEVYSNDGEVLVNHPVVLERLENLDIPLDAMVQSAEARSGSVRITYDYPHEGVLQAELSVRDDEQNHAYTIVGRPSYSGQVNTAYLAVQTPTAQTYLEIVVLNPLEEQVGVELSLRQEGDWKSIRTLSLSPRANERIRVEPDVLLGSSEESGAWTALLKVDYSVTSTEMVTNAWMTDPVTGFSNTALLHEHFPNSNQLYGTQLVSRAFPTSVLANGPVLDGSLVFVNVGSSPSVLSGSLFCDIDSNVTEIPIPDLELQPFAAEVVPLEALVMSRTVSSAMCSGEFRYSGRPGFVIGRYYAASQSKTYGLYVKLEPFVGSAYNEVYWSVQDDFSPLVTVTNFGAAPEVITVSLTESESLAELAKVTIPAHGSFTINVREKVAELRRTTQVKNDYGGLYVWAQTRSGRLLVKQHAINERRAMMVPYYGGYEYITSHYWNDAPSLVYRSEFDSASVTTCYSIGGCFDDEACIYSSDTDVLTVDSPCGLFQTRTVFGADIGVSILSSSVSGPINSAGDWGYVDAFPQQVEVKAKCSVVLKYRPVQGLSANHAFWTIRASSGLTYTTGAGPTGTFGNWGKLNNYLVLGTTGTLPGDNPSAATAWDSGLTPTVCAKADLMVNAAAYWLVYYNNYYDYHPVACPNSNQYAHWVSNAASLSTSAPPNAPCW